LEHSTIIYEPTGKEERGKLIVYFILIMH
jgi:hypothetical protein